MAKTIKTIAAAAALAWATMGALPAFASETELALLSSYVGSWQGSGTVSGGDKPEPFRCRLMISKGNAGKVNYTGRCSLVNANLSISGTIAYNDAASQYEAVMSSNAGYTGLAIGQISGDKISFDLKEKQKDKAGSDVRIASKIMLVDGQISVGFEIEFNDSGKILTATVPFNR